MCRALLLLVFQTLNLALGMGSLPDASQEGLLDQFKGYASLAVFHYTVPPEVTRATWEFASFQDRPECPPRGVESSPRDCAARRHPRWVSRSAPLDSSRLGDGADRGAAV